MCSSDLAPSHVDINRIWIGTDDGVIQTTADGGKTWADVTPPQLQPWAKVSILDTGYTDPLTAYAAINTIRLDDMRPHILRTHDGGKTWTEIVNGIPDGAPVNVVRPDPKKKGLLFAGTETTVYVSFDDGDHWQSLSLNLPNTSYRDLTIKGKGAEHDLTLLDATSSLPTGTVKKIVAKGKQILILVGTVTLLHDAQNVKPTIEGVVTHGSEVVS